MNVQRDDVMATALARLGMPGTPAARALLTLLDETVSRWGRDGRLVGVWVGDRRYVSDLPDSAIDDFEVAPDVFVTDLVGAETAPRILSTIAESLDTGEPRTIEFTTRAIGRTLYLEGSCAPCGDDEVIWVARDRTGEHEAREASDRRAGLETMISDALQELIDVDVSPRTLDEALTAVLHRVATFFGANAAFLRRFRGTGHIEIVAQWQAADLDYSPPGTSRAGGEYFPWAARKLTRSPVLIIPSVIELGPEASTDVANLADGGERGIVWIRIGPARQPTGMFGFTFLGAPPVDSAETYEPLIGFSGSMLAIIDRHEADARRRMQHRVFEAIARGERLETVLAQVCRLRETGAPGHYCVAWLADDTGQLHPIGSASAAPYLGGLDPSASDVPEVEAYRVGTRRWLTREDADLGPVADRIGAEAVDLIPLTTRGQGRAVGIFAVYDTSPLPLDPVDGPGGAHDDLAASLATIAVERVTDLAELAHRATHDSLTGLANRATFLTELERAIAASGPVDRLVAVLYCDIDRFKELNDRLGHADGDRFLSDVARLIVGSTDPHDVVARLGGDEFAIVLTHLSDENDALIVAERIRTSVRTALGKPGRRASVSIGVAVSGSPEDHAEGLLRDADIAMYQAKSSGRDRVEMFAERIRREAGARDQLGRDLAEALVNGDIDVHYQPMVDLADDHLMGFEALARWRHPKRGYIPPAEFIPIAESGGMIGALGDVVLARALESAARWDGLYLHVNLSARQVDTVGYVEGLLDRIAVSGVPVERIAMEITESVLLSESAPTVDNLRVLTDSGVGLVLDDFGTGYASLTYLRRFPFRGIKVDRSFVSGIERSADDAAIVAMVLALASTLGLDVIAEGVETSGQEQLLREMGCRFVQGFRYSVPVPAGRVPALVGRFGSDPSALV